MPSELRLHPLSVVFGLLAQLRRFVFPLLIGTVSAGQVGLSWQTMIAILVLPILVVSITRYISFRYRYEQNELVVKTGLIFRQERHIPYARIQNLDAIQGVFHRLAGVVEVKIQTGAGTEPEATMSVIPASAVTELRRRVFAERGSGAVGDAVGDDAAEEVLLHLPPSELLIYGMIQNRGMIVLAAGLGFAWELGVVERLATSAFGGGSWARGLVDRLAGSSAAGGLALGGIAILLAGLVGLLIVARILSMGWAFVRLHDFTLTRAGEDLRTSFGLLTRVAATIPLRRIQKLTIYEGPLHRLAQRAAVRVDTAGGAKSEQAAEAHRQWLAPVVKRGDLEAFVRHILPELDFRTVNWEPVASGAFRRVIKKSGFLAIAASAPFFFLLGWWAFVVLAGSLVWAIVFAKKYVEHLGWAVTDGAVLFRSGWLWRRVSVARFAKIQAVSLRETPFDRRRQMARVQVDTAGTGTGSHAVHIPYLPVLRARELGDFLSSQAAQTAFRW